MLHAQSAQLDGDRVRARNAFRAMAEREDTRLLGLRGLFIEAQRSEDTLAAVTIAEEALKLSPGRPGPRMRCWDFVVPAATGTARWPSSTPISTAGPIDKSTYRRQRGVLLTARALELEKVDRDRSRESVMEAVKLAPTLVPAAVLASKFESEAHQTRRSMRIVETAWLAQPHPDLADAYAHVRLGDSARQRLVRIETLAAKAPGHLESALAIARAAIDATEFARARAALAPFTAAPTQRVAMLMAEIERTEHGNSGRARAWTLRAVRARHDPVWTADGYVSDRWRPVSPVSGRLDAFQWQAPLASLPSDQSAAIEAREFREAFNEAVPAPRRVEPPSSLATEAAPAAAAASPPSEAPPAADAPQAEQDNAPVKAAAAEPAQAAPPPPAEPPAAVAPPLFFRTRGDIGTPAPASPAIPPVIPIVRPPDDPGIDEESTGDEFAEPIHPRHGQAGGWRGFLTRWGN